MNCKVINYLDANALFKLVNVFDRRVCGIKMPFMTLISHTQKYCFNTYANYETNNVGQLALSIQLSKHSGTHFSLQH